MRMKISVQLEDGRMFETVAKSSHSLEAVAPQTPPLCLPLSLLRARTCFPWERHQLSPRTWHRQRPVCPSLLRPWANPALCMHATLCSIARHEPNVATVQVKESVALLTGVAPEKQKIFFGGRELENADTLAHSLWEALKKVRGRCLLPSQSQYPQLKKEEGRRGGIFRIARRVPSDPHFVPIVIPSRPPAHHALPSVRLFSARYFSSQSICDTRGSRGASGRSVRVHSPAWDRIVKFF